VAKQFRKVLQKLFKSEKLAKTVVGKKMKRIIGGLELLAGGYYLIPVFERAFLGSDTLRSVLPLPDSSLDFTVNRTAGTITAVASALVAGDGAFRSYLGYGILEDLFHKVFDLVAPVTDEQSTVSYDEQ